MNLKLRTLRLAVTFAVFASLHGLVCAQPTITASTEYLSKIQQPLVISWTCASTCYLQFGATPWEGPIAGNGKRTVYPSGPSYYSIGTSPVAIDQVFVDVNTGMSVTKGVDGAAISDSRIDIAVIRAGWRYFQLDDCDDATDVFDDDIEEAYSNGKRVILELDFAPPDVGSDQTNIPTWVVRYPNGGNSCGAIGSIVTAKRFFTDTGCVDTCTNEFPVWWDENYLDLAEIAIQKLIDMYDDDRRVIGYMITGASGVLPPSLAGEQGDKLVKRCTGIDADIACRGNMDCDNFPTTSCVQTSDFPSFTIDHNCPGGDNQTSGVECQDGRNYGNAFERIMNYWATATTKPVIYVTRAMEGAVEEDQNLTYYLEWNVVWNTNNTAVVNNGLLSCENQSEDEILRFAYLQGALKTVGWWGIGLGLSGAENIADAMDCAADALTNLGAWDSRLMFGFASDVWEDDEPSEEANLLFNTPPPVWVEAIDSNATEDPTPTNNGTIRLFRSGNAGLSLAVDLTWSGSATGDIDYEVTGYGSPPTTVTIPADSMYLDLVVDPTDDFTPEADESVSCSIDTDTSYDVGSPSAKVMIESDDE